MSSRFLNALIRRKRIDDQKVDDSTLKRCLSFFDLTCLGIGSTLGLGVYVLAGDVASRNSGPAVCVSFLIAAVASVFAGLCYAEFGARVPRAGSAYIYSYVTVGELMAFIIGWNLVLEYVIGTASVARGYANYIDSLANGTIQEHFQKWVPIHVTGLSSYPDPISFSLTLVLTLLLALGVKESIRLHTIMTVVNLIVVLFVIIAGCFKISWHNWNIDKSEIPKEFKSTAGNGGFLPFGFSGMMSGAATCFYAFVGFDAIATTGEEAKNPKKAIPLSIVFSLFLIFLAYFGISAVQTLMMPYYYQSDEYTRGAPLPWIFEQVGWNWAKWIVSIGALNGLSTSLLGAMYPLPRVLYAMASDGIIFRFLAIVHKRFQTPVYSTLIAGLFAATMASLFNITELADMMSIGTLLAYTLVAESILIIRYSDDVKHLNKAKDENQIQRHLDFVQKFNKRDLFRQLMNFEGLSEPNNFSSNLSNCLIAIISLLITILDALLVFLENDLYELKVVPIFFCGFFVLLIVAACCCLALQPTIPRSQSFEVPWIPMVPFLSVFVNVYLMFKLSYQTWIRFAVWMIIGFLIYFCYGIRNSSERKQSFNEEFNQTVVISQTALPNGDNNVNNTVVHRKEVENQFYD